MHTKEYYVTMKTGPCNIHTIEYESHKYNIGTEM